MADNVQNHIVFVGDSSKDKKFPPNSNRSSLSQDIRLLIQVFWQQLNNFYSLYFLLLGILQSVPDITTTNPFGTFIPVFIYFLICYIQSFIDLRRTQEAQKKLNTETFEAFRDGKSINIHSKSIIPGDILLISDEKPVPCDCLLLSSSQINIFIDTSTIDGETDVKDKFPVPFPPGFEIDRFISVISKVTASAPQSTIISGEIEVGLVDQFSEGNEKQSSEMMEELIHAQPSERQFQVQFSQDNFVERGSVIRTAGIHYFLALYTGTHCHSSAIHSEFSNKQSIVDAYIEKLAIIAFCVQFTTSIILGSMGFIFNSTNRAPYVRPLKIRGILEFIVISTRNYLLLSYMIPITLKMILPIFRMIYGFFISADKNLKDDGQGPKTLSTSITENLGAVDVIVADKTGTLTKNKLKLVSVLCGEKKYGEDGLANDENLLRDLIEPSDSDFILFWKALSVCHSIKFSDSQDLYGSSQDEIATVKSLKELGFVFKTPEPKVFEITAPFGSYRFKVLRVNPFNRERMRMSIVVQDSRGIYCFMKGAPERVFRECTSHSGAMAGLVDIYQNNGLRTLSVSVKEITDYRPDMPLEELESFHRLLGSLGIEDALQDDINLSIDVLQQASLKIWVATGDARPNTIITAGRLRLLRSEDQIVLLRDGEMLEKLNDFSNAAMKSKEDSYSVIIDCESSSIVDKALESKGFIEALLRARCVIFYRCKPYTKGQIAYSLRIHGKRVLAVGDGANDSQLLRAADVGVGIDNGSKSIDSCDFILSSFRFLSRLILVHGHHCLHRSFITVHFSFYKGALFAFCQAIYQSWTSFTGETFFGPFSLMTYNIFWTSIPMIAILFDKDVSDNFLLQLSFLYKDLQNPMKICWENLSWFFIAIYQAVSTMMIAYLLTGEAFFQDHSGKDLGKDPISLLVYFSLVIVTCFHLLCLLNTLTYYSIVAVAGTALLMISVSAFTQSIEQTGVIDARDWSGFYGECFHTWPALLIFITLALAASVPPWTAMTVWENIHATSRLMVIEKETNAAKNDEPLFFTSRQGVSKGV